MGESEGVGEGEGVGKGKGVGEGEGVGDGEGVGERASELVRELVRARRDGRLNVGKVSEWGSG